MTVSFSYIATWINFKVSYKDTYKHNMQNVSLAFFVSNLTVNFEMFMEILRLYSPLCYHPVLFFLCNFVCSDSFLLFHLQSFSCIKGQSLFSKSAFS